MKVKASTNIFEVFYRTFRDISRAVHASTKVDEVLSLVVRKFTKILQALGALIRILNLQSQVLELTAEDRGFWADLMQQGSFALGDYRISSAAKAAIVSGDLLWIKAHVGELIEKQLRWILSRLEMESW